MPTALVRPAPLESVSTTSYRLSTANADTAAAALRDLVAALLRTTGHEALAESARLCTSEVVTNVYRHTRSRLIYVEVTIDAQRVTVYVHDDQPRDLPIPPEMTDGEGGRGLRLVDQCADEWGTSLYGGLIAKTKAVWFRFVEGGRGNS
ncbi:ATP-binding protein [Streptomyces mirabilis]|uniref:ATP-binding protein n=1 Tax=Streptomyces mirabilis TaxID=68239 RepID=UPI003684654F